MEEELSCIASELGHEFSEEILFADQKLEALALLYFERKQGGNLKL